MVVHDVCKGFGSVWIMMHDWVLASVQKHLCVCASSLQGRYMWLCLVVCRVSANFSVC